VLILGSGGAARGIAFTLAMKGGPAAIEILGVEADEVIRLVGTSASEPPSRPWGASDRRYPGPSHGGGRRPHSLHAGRHVPAPRREPGAAGAVQARPLRLRRGLQPLRTRLLEDAGARGLRTLSGAEMFIGQAVVQFELWTGVQAPREVIRGWSSRA